MQCYMGISGRSRNFERGFQVSVVSGDNLLVTAVIYVVVSTKILSVEKS